MRVIVNLVSGRAIKSGGWRARAIRIDGKNEARLSEVLKAAGLKDGSSVLDLIADKDSLKSDWSLYVDGTLLPGASSIERTVKDNVQIHVMDCL